MTEKYTPEKVAELVAEARAFVNVTDDGFYENHLVRALADALTAVSAERDAEHGRAETLTRTPQHIWDKIANLTAERDEAREAAEGHVLAAEATYERLMPRIKKAEAERDRLHKAITEALSFESVLPAIATEPRRILRAALDKEGNET